MHALILAFDRLNANLLGCYGNQQIMTPGFDRLASESVVFDQHFGENFEAAAFARAWWHGVYSFSRPLDQQRGSSQFLCALRTAGVGTCLVHDGAATTANCVADQFSYVDEIQSCDATTGTGLEDVVACVSEHWDRIAANRLDRSLLWVSVAGLPEHPFQTAASHADLLIEGSADNKAFLANVSTGLNAADCLVGQIVDRISQHAYAEQLLLIVTAASGIPFPHVNSFRPHDIHLTECLVHTPLIVRFPVQDHLGSRRRELIQTIDMVPSLLDWYAVDNSAMPTEGQSWFRRQEDNAGERREYICMGIGTQECAIRTADFHLVQTDPLSDSEEYSPRLFLKPEDIWDVHDVADQFPEIVEQLSGILRQFIVNTQSTCPASFSRLP